MRRSGLLALLVLPVLLGGCGYAHKELFPTEYRTVAVPIFDNRTFYQNAQFDLTEAICKEIELRTPYKVVAVGGADTVLTGTIANIVQNNLSRTREGGLPQETELRMVVNFQWKNARTGRVLRDRNGFESIGRYIPARPFTETQDLAQHEAVEAMAREIVSVMAAEW